MSGGCVPMSSDQVPKEAKIASLLLNSSGIQECEPKVVQQLMEYMFSKSYLSNQANFSEYSTEVLQLASVYSDHAQKSVIDSSDVRLATKNLAKKSQNPALDREVNENYNCMTQFRSFYKNLQTGKILFLCHLSMILKLKYYCHLSNIAFSLRAIK